MSREDVLVTTAWAEENLDTPGVVFVEVDEDTSAYEGGHIRNAVRVDWKTELQDQVRRDFVDKAGFEKLLSEKGISNDELEELYTEVGLDKDKATIAYCRIGERSSHTWFALHQLLGLEDVKNYDGSWTEYGSLVGVPIELGAQK